jgi:hypothetical protein
MMKKLLPFCLVLLVITPMAISCSAANVSEPATIPATANPASANTSEPVPVPRTAHTASANTTPTIVKKTMQPQSPRTGPYPIGLAGEAAMNYVADRYKVPIQGMMILGIQSSVEDFVSNEVVAIANVFVKYPDGPIYKIVVDPKGNCALLDKAYYDSISRHYREAFGSMDLYLYLNIQPLSSEDIVRVLVYPANPSIIELIQSRGFETEQSQVNIRTKIPKSLIGELAFDDRVNSIVEDLVRITRVP